MKKRNPHPSLPLREQAESLLDQQDKKTAASATEEAKLIHELQVHQIELQLQNEELRRSQIALEESRQRFSDLYHHAPLGYVVLNRSGIIVESNATFAGMLEAECSTINGRAFADLLTDEDSGIFRARLRSFFKQPFQKHMELRLRLDRHRALHIELSSSSLPRDSAASAINDTLLLSVTDISIRKRLEAEQNTLAATVKQLDKEASLSRLAGAVAHNFNNMLMVILGNLEMAEEKLPRGELPLKELRDAQRAAMRAAETSTLMLTYLGQNRAKKARIDLAMICDQVLPPLLRAKPNEVTISCSYAVDKVEVLADTTQLGQVVNNMVANALEALQDKPGRITLELSTARMSDIAKEYRFPTDWQRQEEEFACLTVRDDGCGMAPETMEMIFDPFYTSKFPGRGMGLSVVLGILRAHDGCITVASSNGAGSTFRIFLPIAPPAE